MEVSECTEEDIAMSLKVKRYESCKGGGGYLHFKIWREYS